MIVKEDKFIKIGKLKFDKDYQGTNLGDLRFYFNPAKRVFSIRAFKNATNEDISNIQAKYNISLADLYSNHRSLFEALATLPYKYKGPIKSIKNIGDFNNFNVYSYLQKNRKIAEIDADLYDYCYKKILNSDSDTVDQIGYNIYTVQIITPNTLTSKNFDTLVHDIFDAFPETVLDIVHPKGINCVDDETDIKWLAEHVSAKYDSRIHVVCKK